MIIGATLATAAMASEDALRAEIDALKAQMAELSKAQKSINIEALKDQLLEVKVKTGGDNIKWDVDFRTAYDIVDYKINGAADKDNALWTNKLILGMAAQPLDNLTFHGSLGFYKAFGQSNIGAKSFFQDFDWYNNQKPQADNSIRLREAYFLYNGQMGDVPYTASFGRRPSVDGFMTNLREDNAYPTSPVGHNINMEFDGASFMFNFEKVTDISGLYFKICLGRGFSDTTGAYSSNGAGGFNPAYINDTENPNMDLAGVLMQLYDNGQYKLMGNYFVAWNLMGLNMGTQTLPTGPVLPTMYFKDVGDMTGGSLSLQVNGIGNEINDFLDDTIAFASFAWMETDPNTNIVGTMTGGTTSGMLGSTKSETGTSYYVGVNMPAFMDADRIGLEYNHGSKYWRSFTYGEDTLAGSKLATRGDAYEIYYNLPLLGKNLTAQVRYTYMDYDYTGSDMFFGQTGTPMDVDTTTGAVQSASNIRLSMRYRY